MLPLGVLVLAALAVGSPLTRSPAPGNTPHAAPGAAPEQLFTRRDHPDHKSPLGLAEPVRPAAHNPLRRRATPDAPDTPTTNGLDAAASYFLPTDIRPTYYNMTLAPNMTTFTFNGQVQIFFNVIKSTNKIVFHAKQLTWKDADVEVYLASGEDGLDYFADIVKVERNSFNEQVTLTLSEPLQAKSRYMLWFPSFDGKLNDDLDGFYRSSYMANGEKRWLATTQFEPTGARRAFPCWDEPSFKARFEIYIKHDPMLTAISNMPSSQKTETEDGQVITAFSQTLPMSSYLVAFIVSDFGTETNEKGNFSTWARKDILSGSGMSQQLGPQALQVLANFNGIDYMMPKMDQAAIPDFEAGAMENWGLVTYREPYLITNSDMKASEEERIATVICHEFGHQWTGDLVTLGWWSHTWLNEGFATFYESMTCAEIKPEWNLEDKMLPNYYHVAMESDVREDQISMCNPVSSYDEIENMFGVISYKKGGSVLRMFYHAMTPEVFKMAMKRYLSIRMYKNSSPEHLFTAFEYAANSTDPSLIPEGYTFRDLMRTFTDFAGVPLVTVTRGYDDQVVEFKQERFFYTAPSDPSLVEQAWWIPITVVSGDKPEWSTRPQSWLNPDQTVSQAASDVPADQWLLINPKQTGYFRVNYDKKNWKLLSAALAANPSTFPAATRAQLLNDALAMAQADRLDYAVALTFFQAFKKEREVAPWQAAVTAIQYLTARLANTPVYPSFLALIKDITADAYDSVGYTTADKDSHDTKYLRYYMASYACWSGNEKCLSAAAAALKTWMANPKTNKMQPDTRDTSMCYGLRASDAATFQAMAKLWQDEKDATLRTTCLSALSCSADSGLITSLLADSLTKYSVDDGVAVFNAVYDRRENHNVLMDFVKKNAPAIRKRFENNFDYQVLDGLIRDIRTREEYAEVQSWVYQTYGDTDGYDNLKASFQSVEMDLVTWYDKFYTSTSVWLSAAEPITTQAPTQGPTHGPTQGPTGMPSTTTTTPAGAATTTLSTTLILAGLLSAMLHLLH